MSETYYIVGDPPVIGEEVIVNHLGELKIARVVCVEQDTISSNEERGVFAHVKFIRRLRRKERRLFQKREK